MPILSIFRNNLLKNKRGIEMKTILGDKLEDYKVVDSLGEDQGKLKDVIVDTTTQKWPVRDLVVSTGVIEKKAVCFKDIADIDNEKKIITLKDNIEPHEYDDKDFSKSYIAFNELKKRDVYCENDTEVGSIYDYVIGYELEQWEIHNLLINPKGDWLKGRRIRMDVKDVSEVKDRITVKSNREEIQDKCAVE
jgi:sporulation protein YlmC with PRC-barrel domain